MKWPIKVGDVYTVCIPGKCPWKEVCIKLKDEEEVKDNVYNMVGRHCENHTEDSWSLSSFLSRCKWWTIEDVLETIEHGKTYKRNRVRDTNGC